MPSVLTERRDEVLLVTLNRPESYNAFDRSVNDGLAAAWVEAAQPDVRAVVITGAGKGFCAGADLLGGSRGADPATDTVRHTYNTRVLMLAALEKPVIAAVTARRPVVGWRWPARPMCGSRRRRRASCRRSPGSLAPDCGASYFIVRMLGYARAFE